MQRRSHLPPGVTARILAAVLVVFGIASPVLAEAFKARTDDGEVVLVQAGERFVVAADGRRTVLPLAGTATVHSFAAAGRKWYAAAVDRTAAGPRLVLLGGGEGPVAQLPAPPTGRSLHLREPTLLVGATGLGALAWLEGRTVRQLALRAAAWGERGWEPPVTIARPGPGSQLALTAAVLGDGSQLLAWAAFDGHDDEILWSRRVGDVWSEPVRVAADNEMPDITPHLLATASGAVLAWSRYDGNDYRVTVAGFSAGSWSEPRTVGPRGSVAPTLSAGPEGPLLLFRQAVPRAWAVLETGASGEVRGRAEVATARDERPLVGPVNQREITLRWPGDGAPDEKATLPWNRSSGGSRAR